MRAQAGPPTLRSNGARSSSTPTCRPTAWIVCATWWPSSAPRNGSPRFSDAIEQAGEAEGIKFVFDRIARTPNTVDSHRLIEYAGQQGVQDQVVEALFRRYFEQGEDIGDRAVLAAAGVDGGLDEEAVENFLAGTDGAEHVRRESEAASRMGISGVPCFIFEGKYAVSGAQPPDVFERVFELAVAANTDNSAESPLPTT